MSEYLDRNSLWRYVHDISSESACSKYEWKRLATLKDLPKESAYWAIRLARDGFFCDANTDEIRCHFCGFIISSNDDNSNKTDEHKKSACPIFTDQNCVNVPIRCANESMEVMAGSNTVEADGRNIPKYPEYKEYEKRRESFDGVKDLGECYIHRLAIQGFFKTGASLSARCHYCGFDLRYNPRIDPFEAHAALFGNCEFLEQEKGKEFIEMHKERHRLSQKRNAPGQEFLKRVPCKCDEDVESMPQTSSSNNFPPVNQNDTGARPKQLTPRFKANEESTTIKDGNNKIACKICLDAEVQICFLPCGHLVTCENCAAQCSHCDVCKQEIKGRMKCFPS